MNSEEILRKTVTRLREQRGWSIQELASRLNLDRTYLSKSESGKRSFKVSEVNRLAEIFGVTTDYLLGRSKDDHDDQDKSMTKNQKLVAYSIDPDISDEERQDIINLVKIAMKNRRRI